MEKQDTAGVSNETPVAPLSEGSKMIKLPSKNSQHASDEDVRYAILQYAENHPGFDRRFAKEMVFTKKCENAYSCEMETFVERKTTALQCQPYKSEQIERGPMLDPSEKYMTPTNLPVNQKFQVEVPGSAFVKNCYRCSGENQIACCAKPRQEYTRNLNGNAGGKSCCGTKTCPECEGSGKLKFHDVLSVTDNKHREQIISEPFNLPKNLFREDSGNEIYEKIVWGIKATPIITSDPRLNREISELVLRHERALSQANGRVIYMQKLTLREIPLTKVEYRWRNKTGKFYVYGLEKKVYFKKCPQKSRCYTCRHN